jgi:DNA-binding LacI/PurR family transcriptional regulator
MFSNMLKAAEDDAVEMEPGSDTREKSVDALWAAAEGSEIEEEEELRKAKVDSLIVARAALSALEVYRDDRDAAMLAAKRC